MRLRKLRITWSVFWGIACVLLIALWVRSYRATDSVYGRIPTLVDIGGASQAGQLMLAFCHCGAWDAWHHFSVPYGQGDDLGAIAPASGFGWVFADNDDERYFFSPHWFVAVVFTMFASAPWIGQRFSLRTLLIATTLVALVLGLVVWAARK
jgi:hypothetical protein